MSNPAISGMNHRRSIHMSNVSKSDLAGLVAERTDLSAAQAKEVVDATFDVIASRVAAGDEVAIGGFGKFSVTERSARTGRNPQTGETMQIAASKAPKFSAASAFKAAVKD
jgi:DNA-binding protein HU-beta